MSRKNTYYPRLEAKIAETGTTKRSIAERLDISQKTLSYKLSGKYDFGFKEAVTIHKEFFPDVDILELFAHK